MSREDLPQRSASHDIEAAAETALRAAVTGCNFFVIQQQDLNDYGTDVQLEARAGDAMTNIRVHVQLKGTSTAQNVNSSISISVSRRNLNYLLAQKDSLYVCYHLPTQRLLARYAEDVYSEYEHRAATWDEQETVTVRFNEVFDDEFQQRLNARLIAAGRTSTAHRLEWAVTPPDRAIPLLRAAIPEIHVPAQREQAEALLAALYGDGNDAAISKYFEHFAAVLGAVPGGMDLAYMAEINLGLNGFQSDSMRIREAIDVCQQAIESRRILPASGLYCIGNAWSGLGEYQQSQQSYQQAMSLLEGTGLVQLSAQCCKNLGSVLESQGLNDEARHYYERALEFDSTLAEAWLALALCHWRKDQLGEALNCLDRIAPRPGSHMDMAIVQGYRMDILFKMGEWRSGFREIANLLDSADRYDWVWPWCARNVAQFGRRSSEVAESAFSFWNRYLDAHPTEHAAERERILCTWQIHAAKRPVQMNFDEFEVLATRLIEGGDSNPAFLWDRVGHWAAHDGRWEVAEGYFRRAYDLEPANYGCCMGAAYNHLGRYMEAVDVLSVFLDTHEDDPVGWFNLAHAWDSIGHAANAIDAYERALALDKDYAAAMYNLGGVYWNAGQQGHACEVWKVAVARFPEHELAKKVRERIPELN